MEVWNINFLGSLYYLHKEKLYLSGFIPVILNPSSKTNNCENKLDILLEKINIIDAKNICSIISSTNCSLPREADDIGNIAKICRKYEIAHIIINEDGLQNAETMLTIKEAYK